MCLANIITRSDKHYSLGFTASHCVHNQTVHIKFSNSWPEYSKKFDSILSPLVSGFGGLEVAC